MTGQPRGPRPEGRRRRKFAIVVALGVVGLAVAIGFAVRSETCDVEAATALERRIICEQQRTGSTPPACPSPLTLEECARARGSLGGEHPGVPGKSPSP